MKKILLLCCFSLFITCSVTPSYAQIPLYYLCGPDEDGCPKGYEQYCACIPYNDQQKMKPYCLDFDKMTCEPVSNVSDCAPDNTYKDQGSCLATIFQSEPTPPCSIVTKTFCEDHHASMCDENGDPESCR